MNKLARFFRTPKLNNTIINDFDFWFFVLENSVYAQDIIEKNKKSYYNRNLSNESDLIIGDEKKFNLFYWKQDDPETPEDSELVKIIE